MKAVIYARYSTDNQNPDTIEVQVDRCARYAQDHGLTIADVYADEAVSGMKDVRPELARFFRDSAAGKFQRVIIYDQSRFSRDIVDWFTFRRALDKQNIRLFSATQQFVGGDLDDPAVFASEGINALVNQIHVLQTRQKVKEKMTYMATQGLHTGGRPLLGYDVVDKRYSINDSEAAIVRLIFVMYAAGKSYREIMEMLNQKGYRTKAGRPFGSNSLHNLLANERYIGVYTYNKIPPRSDGKRNSHAVSPNMIRIEGGVPAIVTKELWDKVKKRMSCNKTNAKNSAKAEYLLSGKVVCGECGMSYCGAAYKNGQYFYYECSGRKRLHNCDMKAIPKELLESRVIQVILDNALSPEVIEVTARGLYDAQARIKAEIHPKKKLIQKRLAEVETKMHNINTAIAQGMFSASTTNMLKDLERQQASLYQELGEVEGTAVSTRMEYDEIVKTLHSIAEDFKESENRRAIAQFVEKVAVYADGTIRIHYNPFDSACSTTSIGAANRT